MDADGVNFLEWTFRVLVGGCLTAGGWMWAMLVKAVGKNRDDLAAHRLSVAENYARKADLTDIYGTLNEIRRDIKQLLIGTRGKGDE